MSNSITTENVNQIIKSGFSTRFQNLNPTQFEEVICLLFSKIYTTSELTKNSADFGCDVLCEDEYGERIVIQCKRYKDDSKVGNKYVDNVISAKVFYGAKKGIIVTTSDFTKNATIIAEKDDIELWNWEKTLQMLSLHFNDGEPYLNSYTLSNNQELVRCSSIDIDIDTVEKHFRECYFIKVEIENLTDEVFHLEIKKPTIINNRKQFDMDYFWDGYFKEGIIYPDSIVTTGFIFKTDKVGEIDSENFNLFLPIFVYSIEGNNLNIIQKKNHLINEKKLNIDDYNYQDSTETVIEHSKSNESGGKWLFITILIIIYIIVVNLK